MKCFSGLFLLAVMATVAHAQFFRGMTNGFNGFFRSVNSGFRSMVHPVMSMFSAPTTPFTRPGIRPDGTDKPQSTGIDKKYPDDCGRNKKGKGNLCFPDGELCKNSKELIGLCC
jgi:hypothetical protein